MMDILHALREGLAPHYTVDREIDAGGMARVYLAAERHPPRRVAIKVMNPELSTASFRERFIREVEVTSKLSHPHIVPILAADECLFVPDGPDGLCYYVMPYIEGESLRVRLDREQRLPLAEALRLTLEVADALSYAHAHGVVHRDVKPENILLSKDDHAYVADFGIARAVSAAGVPTLTGVGQAVGSPAYMSPEQLAGSRAIDARTDIYSLGCVLYEMLVGEPPLLHLAHGSAPGRAALEAFLREQGVDHRTARFLKEVIGRALAASPADRFASVDDFVACLRDVVDRRGSAAWLPKISWKAATIGGLAVLLIAAAGAAFLMTREPALDPRRVVVAGFEDLSGDAALAPLGHLAADWVTQGLARGGAVEVVPAAIGGHLDAAGIQELTARTGAGTVVSGSYYRDGDSVRFQLQIIDAVRGTVSRIVEPVSAPSRTPLAAADAVRRRVAATFDTLFAR
ncbi:MAG TPA: serine/threonine-protein kinase [Gemmatimonadales bacterium]|nr:serine/threonine-protein kinase [Gemmatimonadales bacterium]